MLEYDNEYEDTYLRELYYRNYCYGYQIGVLEGHFPIVKSVLSEMTEDEIRGKEPPSKENEVWFKIFSQEILENYYDFFNRYGNLSTERQILRYIAESEFLPWR